MSTHTSSAVEGYRFHPTKWKDFAFVYPVLSRRMGGISFGINLSPDQKCNFDCVYCQVERGDETVSSEVGFLEVEKELDALIQLYKSGELLKEEPFVSAPKNLLALKDIAFSGDGEPTLFGPFEAMMELVAHLKTKYLDRSVKLILITNGSGLSRPSVQRGLDTLWNNQGEIWVKLDAGTSEHFKKINRTQVPFEKILENILMTAKVKPVIIQTMFSKLDGKMPDSKEVEAYSARIKGFIGQGGRIKEVQLYTLARQPAEANVSPLTREELNGLGTLVSKAISLPVTCYAEDGAFSPC